MYRRDRAPALLLLAGFCRSVCVTSDAEQLRIVAEVDRRLSVLDELEALVSANLQRATRLRQSILQRAFAGELTSQ